MADTANNKLKTKRGLLKWWFFSIITLGIYDLYLIHAWAKETNIVCSGDGKKTRGLVLMCLFTCLTLGIYSIVWFYKLANRTKAFVDANGGKSRISGGSYLLWTWLGLGIVAQYKLIHQINEMNKIYNAKLDAEAHAAAEAAAATAAAPAPVDEAPVDEAPVDETPSDAE